MSVPEHKGPQLQRIDWANGQLKGKLSGKTYFIQHDLSVERYGHFLAFQPLITKGASYQEWSESNNRIHAWATNGSDILGSLHHIATETMNMNNTWREFTGRRVHAIIWFAMLFVNAEDEDIAVWDERLVQIKIDDLKHYPFSDFFFLVRTVLKEWWQKYRQMTGHDHDDIFPPSKTVEETLSQENIASI